MTDPFASLFGPDGSPFGRGDDLPPEIRYGFAEPKHERKIIDPVKRVASRIRCNQFILDRLR